MTSLDPLGGILNQELDPQLEVIVDLGGESGHHFGQWLPVALYHAFEDRSSESEARQDGIVDTGDGEGEENDGYMTRDEAKHVHEQAGGPIIIQSVDHHEPSGSTRKRVQTGAERVELPKRRFQAKPLAISESQRSTRSKQIPKVTEFAAQTSIFPGIETQIQDESHGDEDHCVIGVDGRDREGESSDCLSVP